MHEWDEAVSLRQELILTKRPHTWTANIEAVGATFEAAFLTAQVHFRLMLDQQGVDWRSVDPHQPKIPDPSEVQFPE